MADEKDGLIHVGWASHSGAGVRVTDKEQRRRGWEAEGREVVPVFVRAMPSPRCDDDVARKWISEGYTPIAQLDDKYTGDDTTIARRRWDGSMDAVSVSWTLFKRISELLEGTWLKA